MTIQSRDTIFRTWREQVDKIRKEKLDIELEEARERIRSRLYGGKIKGCPSMKDREKEIIRLRNLADDISGVIERYPDADLTVELAQTRASLQACIDAINLLSK